MTLPGRARSLAVLLGLAQLLSAAGVRAQSPQEKRRRDILDKLGLQKKPAPPPAPEALPGDDTQGVPPAETPPAKAAGGDKGAAARPTAPTGPSFRRAVHPLLVATCKPCHVAGGPAGASRLLLTGDAAADHRATSRFADVRNPDGSALLAKASGATLHGGGAPWPSGSAPYQRVVAWIRAGARLDGGAAPAPAEEPSAPRAAVPPRRTPPPSTTAGAPVPGAPAGEPTPSVPAAPAASPSPAPPVPPPAAPPGPPKPPAFAEAVHPVLMRSCAACHGPAGPAAKTRLVLSGAPAADEAAARALIDPVAPEQSLLVTKASGEMHAGGALLPAGDPRLDAILAWIQSFAPPPPAPGTTPALAGPLPPAAHVPPTARPHDPRPAHGAPGGAAGLALPFGFMLNGRFSLDYERRGFSGNPYADGSVAALRSYHHFLFLSRDLVTDPCGFSVEVLTLQFWEASCRVRRLPAGVRLAVAGGKIVVPFGADPLYHQNYGGLGGFDQRILPVIWAVEGVAAHFTYERRGLVVTDDVFVIRGYALPRADAVINLQNDFSPADATKLGWGNRLGAAWMFASAWYSAYYNPLGFGRRLFMQALDVTIWRPRRVPVLGHFSLGAGLLRADVSGGGDGSGGPGKDYYDFGSYLQLRYYPLDWLYIQYRQGLHTFDNRLGVIVDNSRLTAADGSTHNFAIVARYAGLTAGLYYFINLDKVNEVKDDLLRLSVIYEF